MSDVNVNGNNEPNASWFALIAILLAIFIISIDMSFLNVSIIPVVHDLHTTISALQSIIVIYSLVLASLTLLSGELQKVLGRKRAFLIGTAIYGVGTLIAATSINSNMLLLGWSILEGIGGALMWVSVFSIVVGSYSGKKRAQALGLVISVSSAAGIIGPIIGGILTTYFTWRYAFGLEFIIVLIIFLFSKSIPSFPKTMGWSNIDIIGAVNSGLGIFLLIYGLLLLNNPATRLLSILVILIGIVLLIIFYFSQRNRINKNKHPLVDIRIFKIKSFYIGNLIRFLYGFAISGITFIIPVFVQTVLKFNALTTSYIFVAMAIPMLIITFTTGEVSERFQPRRVISLGLLICLVGSIYLTSIFSIHSNLIQIVLGVAVLGLGVGILAPHSSNLTFHDISQDKQPDATAIRSTNSNLSSSAGTAVLGLILLIGTFNGLSNEKLVGGAIDAFITIIILLFVAIIISQFIPKKEELGEI